MGRKRPPSSKEPRTDKSGRSAGILLPDLRKKVECLKYALDMRNDADFAGEIRRKPSTFSEYFTDRGGYEENAVPRAALSDMAGLLVRTLGNTVTLEEARTLWRGPLADFEAAFEKAQRLDFRALVLAGRQIKLMTFVRHERSLSLKMIDFLEDDPADDRTRVGDVFHFDCVGPPGHWLVVL